MVNPAVYGCNQRSVQKRRFIAPLSESALEHPSKNAAVREYWDSIVPEQTGRTITTYEDLISELDEIRKWLCPR